jgi:hypothetical protein
LLMDLSRLPRLESRLGSWRPYRVQELDRKGREEMPKKLCVLCCYGFLSAQANPSTPAAASITFSTFQFSRLITSTFPSGYRRRTPGPAAQGSGRGPHRLGRCEPPSSVICQRRLSDWRSASSPAAIQRGRRAVSDGGQIDPAGDLVSCGVDHCQAGTPLVGGEDPASILRHRYARGVRLYPS